MRVVLCQDQRQRLEALAAALAECGHVVQAATTSPSDAVHDVQRYDPDVLLTDLSFPVGSGLDTARKVQERHPRTKVVVIVGADEPTYFAEALEVGVSGYVLKGQRIEAISAAIEVAAGGGFTVYPALLQQLPGRKPIPQQRRRAHQLTERERTVLELLARGFATRQIVRRLGVSESTVRTHVQNILAKLGVHSRLQAVVAYEQTQHGHRASSDVDTEEPHPQPPSPTR